MAEEQDFSGFNYAARKDAEVVEALADVGPRAVP